MPLNTIISKQETTEKNKDEISQKVSRVFVNVDETPFRGKSVREEICLVFEVVERKPYLVGVQEGTSVIFFSRSVLEELQKTMVQYLTTGVEK